MDGTLRWRVCAAAGAVCALLVLVTMTAPRSKPTQLLSNQKAGWDQQEESLWKAVDKTARPKLVQSSEKKLKQIVHSLRKNHLLRGKKLRQMAALVHQPHFGPGKVVEAAGQAGFRVFQGRMLCAEGEKSCTHPCNAFYTITGEEPPEDCKCKCTSPNPHSFYKAGSVICTCPGSPISPDNDMYPYPPGEGPLDQVAADEIGEAPAPAAMEAAPAATLASSDAPAPVSTVMDADAAAPAPDAESAPEMRGRYPVSLAGMPYMGVSEHAMRLEQDIDARLANMGVKVQPLQQMQPAMAPNGMLQGPQGLWVGSGPAFLPPDGDYPGGSTGIPEDGYLAFETGYGTQPYHGTTAPMQEAGIAYLSPATSLHQLRGRRQMRVVNKALGQAKWDNDGNPIRH